MSCKDTDFCASCYASWKSSDGKMEVCKGHTFREVPRPCWYTLKPGTVTEDGKTLAEIVQYLLEHFAELLNRLKASELSCSDLSLVQAK
jgi:hypothetical protein